jgi:hypothetical protein
MGASMDNTYTGVSFIAVQYFYALVDQEGLSAHSKHYSITEEDLDTLRSARSFRVEIYSPEAYTLIQRVFTAENS